jgi:hypothetical protein
MANTPAQKRLRHANAIKGRESKVKQREERLQEDRRLLEEDRRLFEEQRETSRIGLVTVTVESKPGTVSRDSSNATAAGQKDSRS